MRLKASDGQAHRCGAPALSLAVALIAASVAWFSGCASLRFEGAAALRIDCDVAAAQVFIDDAYVGQAEEWSVDGRLVKPGFHRLEIRYPDRYTHYEELELAKGDAVRVRANLRPVLEWM
ncbi:MAG: hypothetical protein SF187_27415 [Deltaproteobacteria bacterium]|nr:hypothetical protein [Deltaproteobacteria bacterium]